MTADQFATEGGEGMSQSNTLPYYQYMGNPILHAQQNSISYLLNLSINTPNTPNKRPTRRASSIATRTDQA